MLSTIFTWHMVKLTKDFFSNTFANRDGSNISLTLLGE